MRYQVALAALVVALSVTVVWGQTAGIPDVKTAEELAKLPVIHVGNGWDVQLGLAEPGPIEGPWKFIVCRATRTGQGKSTISHNWAAGELLGPVSFDCQWNGLDRALNQLDAMQQSVGDGQMYIGTVLLAREGTCDLRVYGSGGAVLAERTIAVKEPAPCYWAELVRSRAFRRLPQTRALDANELAKFVPPDAAAVYPFGGQSLRGLPFKPGDVLPLRVSVADAPDWICRSGLGRWHRAIVWRYRSCIVQPALGQCMPVDKWTKGS